MNKCCLFILSVVGTTLFITPGYAEEPSKISSAEIELIEEILDENAPGSTSEARQAPALQINIGEIMKQLGNGPGGEGIDWNNKDTIGKIMVAVLPVLLQSLLSPQNCRTSQSDLTEPLQTALATIQQQSQKIQELQQAEIDRLRKENQTLKQELELLQKKRPVNRKKNK